MAIIKKRDNLFTFGSHVPAQLVAKDVRTLGELFQVRARRTPHKASCFQKVDGSWRATSWRELYDLASRVARGLFDLGLEGGDVVAILGRTSVDWARFDLGAQLLGLVTMGIYPHQSVDQVRYLLSHSRSRVVFVGDAVELETTLAAAKGLDHLEAIVPWSAALAEEHAGSDPRVRPPARFDAEPLDEQIIRQRLETIDDDATAVLVYTSGTTGRPKGAMLTQRNLIAFLRSQAEMFELHDDDLLFSFLPMAHIGERTISFYTRINAGVPAAYASSIGAVLTELPEVGPTVFGSVPRIFEKVYAKVHSEVAQKPVPVRALFRWADTVGRRRARLALAGEAVPAQLAVQYWLASALVFRKVQAALGGRVRACIVGAAPIATEILEFLWAAGMPTYELYGLTEATGCTHINRLDRVKLGTTGPAIPPTECRIADDGELLLRGPLVFKGYLDDAEATEETLVDGWLQTGDIGDIDDEGFLRITDRKKHLIITAGGKNIAPATIERVIKGQSPLISQVHPHGDRRPYVCALIAPSPIETLEWGVRHGVVTPAELQQRTEELMKDPTGRSAALNRAMARVAGLREFQHTLLEPVRSGNRELSRVEQVRRFVVLDRDFSQEEGELTPTMKLKRKVIETKYAELFDRIYNEERFAIEAEPA